MAKVLNAETLAELKCFSCGCYLSVGPVTVGSDGNNICGRCPAESNHVGNKIVEILAMAYEFPCRYDVNGCSVSLPFGTEMIEHETVCEFKFKIGQNVCPITDTCQWKGETGNIFQHCVDEHAENVLKSLTFDVNLETSENKKFIIKFGSNRLFLLHLLYSTESDGLSITVRNLTFETHKQLLDTYDLLLESSEGGSMCFLKEFDNGRYITKDALTYLDETSVMVELNIPCSEEDESKSVCDLCDCELSSYYLLQCDSQHCFCTTCSQLNDVCKVCNTYSFLNIKTNYYILMRYKTGVFVCCNAMFGCKFSGIIDNLKIHEETCKVYHCFILNCKWSGDIVEHIEKMHQYFTETDVIEVKHDDIDNDDSEISDSTTYFVTTFKRCSFCNCSRYSPKMLVVIEVCVVTNGDLVQITANYANSHPNFSFCCISVTLGKNFTTYANKINPVLLPDMSINYENSIYVPQELFKKHKCLLISVNDSKFVCDEHKNVK